MGQTARVIVRLIGLLFLAFVVVQPYNWYCKSQGSCSQFFFSDLLPSIEGKQTFQIAFEVKNYRPDVEISIAEPQLITTVTGRKNTVNYQVENLTNHAVRFRPEFYIDPSEMKEHIVTKDCLCFREHIIKKGEKLILKSTFKVRSSANVAIEDRDAPVRIGYIVR